MNESKIPTLKHNYYFVVPILLDGDAPKQFIKVYEYGLAKRGNRASWIPYIAKTAEKWYPHESIIEYLINRIGIELGLMMNQVKLIRINGQIRFLSRYFLQRDEILIHGAEVFGDYLANHMVAKAIADDRKVAKQLFNFKFTEDAIRHQYPAFADDLLNELVKMLIFDAIVGNNDRHFYNWGLITSKIRDNKPPRIAPIYDSARGLYWNTSDARIRNIWQNHNENGRKVVNYISKASPRLCPENNDKANHFDLIEFLSEKNEEYRKLIWEFASVEKERRVVEMIQKEFKHFFLPERNALINFVLATRFKTIRESI